jgi:hypothetical protein
MSQPIIEALQRENEELRERIEQFRRLLVEVFEPRVIDFLGPEARSRMIHAMSATEIGPHLRELALRCQGLARESSDAGIARELGEIGGELADRASSLEAAFTAPRAPR